MRVGLFHKLLGVNLSLALAVLLVSSSIFALSARRVLVRGLGDEAVRLAEDVAGRLAAEELAPLLADPPDPEAWRRWVRRLEEIQGELGPAGVENVYLLAPRGGLLWVAADPTGDDPPFGQQDTVFVELKRRAFASGRPAATPEAYTDAWGTWISGYAPMPDSTGRARALLGIDLPLGAFPLMRDIIARELVMSALPAALLALVVSLLVSGYLARPARRLTRGLRQVRSGELDVVLDEGGGDEFGEMAVAFNRMVRELQERERVQALFAQSVSPEVARKLLSDDAHTGGEIREASVLFADIRGFTGISESLSARGVIALLNEYFERLIPCVEAEGGVVDKLIGDEIMALFGAPTDLPDDAAAAVQAALRIRDTVAAFNAGRPEGPPLEVGIGISTGAVVAGALGSRTRRNYTVLGTVVNLGSRLCGHAGPGQILVSRTTYLRTRSLFEMQEIPAFTPKGISFPVQAFEVLGIREGPGAAEDAAPEAEGAGARREGPGAPEEEASHGS